MKRVCFAAILFLSLVFGCALAAKDKEKTEPIKSLSVTEYSGDEEKPVTLPAGFKLSREAVMKNVDNETAVIIIYNGTGRDLRYFQLDLNAPGAGIWAGSRGQHTGRTVRSFHGIGALLKGEKRVIKIKDRAPFSRIRLVYSDESYRPWGTRSASFHKQFNGGVPYLFTISKDGKDTWKEWKR